jgi:serine/threonine protein kinase
VWPWASGFKHCKKDAPFTVKQPIESHSLCPLVWIGADWSREVVTTVCGMTCDIIRLTSVDEKYQIIAEIGKGTYGKVYKCREQETGTICALKKINILEKLGGFPLNTIREINLLRALHHDNIIGLRAIVTSSISKFGFSEESAVYLAFDYCEFDLYGLLYGAESILSIMHVISYIKQMLIALKVCHDNHIVHRDLKPANLFVTRGNVLRLGDFGLARKIAQDRDVCYTSKVITLYYRAPELLLGCQAYGYEVDMWSIGCIIYEMITKQPLFQATLRSGSTHVQDSDQCEAIWNICGHPNVTDWPEVKDLPEWALFRIAKPHPDRLKDHLAKTIPSEYADSIDLLLRILVLTPSKRITAEEATLHPFLTRFGREIEPSSLEPIRSHMELHQMGVSAERKKRLAEAKAKTDSK